jgi:PAS domain S-box-containing protein
MSPKKKTAILVVEKKEDDANRILKAFQTRGADFDITLARNLAEGRACIDQSIPDLVIAEMNLPDGKGDELIPQKSETASYPVVIMNADDSEDITDHLIKKGALDILLKSDRALDHLPRVADRAIKQWNNILKLKKSEEKVVETERRFSSLISNIPGVVYRCGNDAIILLISKPIENITGYPQSSFTGKNIRFYNNLIHGADQSHVEKTISKAMKLRIPYSLEYRVSSKDGSLKWVLEQGQGIYNDNEEWIYRDATIFEITSLKVAEIRIRESEEKFRTMFEEAPLGVALINSLTGQIYEVNLRFAEIVGRTREEMANIDWMSITHPDDVQEDLDNMALLNAGKITGFSMNKRYLRPDNSYVWINMTVAPMTIADNNCRHHLCMIEDITMRRQAEEKIQKLSRVVEQSPVSIIITDKSGQIEYVNPSFSKSTGYQKEEVLGKTPNLLKSGETPPEEYKQLWRTILSGKNWYGVFHNRKKDGTLFWESAVISPIKNASGQTTHFLAIKENITLRKSMEERLLESEKRFRVLIEQAADIIYVHDDDGNLIHVNQKACESLGYTHNEFSGMNIDALETKWNLESLKELWQAITPSAPISREGVFKRKDGSSFPVEVNISQIKLGGSIRYLALARDVSARKETEARLRRAENQAINSEKLASIGQLAAGVSHEVLNPVNIISVHTQILKRKRKEDEALQEFCDKIRHEVDRIQKIMGTLLIFSRKGDPVFEKIQPREIIDDTLALVEQNFFLDNITIQRNWHSENPVYIQGDKDKLRQVFLNLVNNAKQAMVKSGTLTLGSALIDKNNKKFIQLTFSDTGPGIKKELKTRLFEPFFSTKPEGEGTGLGLSLANRIIEDHGGSIYIESEEGKGATFFIDLPLA